MLTKQGSIAIRNILSTRCRNKLQNKSSTALTSTRRWFQSESQYHDKADHTLNTIQDTLDFYFEDNPEFGSPDIDYSSGVLTIALSEGTWVLNKQTPNQQIWWSSPITGPRRYEFDDNGNGKWIWTRYTDFKQSATGTSASTSANWDDTRFLGEALKKEMVDIFHEDIGLEDLDDQ